MLRRLGYTLRKMIAVLAVVLLGMIVLPAIRTSLGVGHTNLDLIVEITDPGGRPLKDVAVTLFEIQEGSANPLQTVRLRTDEQGRAVYAFANVTTTDATDLLGRERDFQVALPWWELEVQQPGYRHIKRMPLPKLANQLGLHAERHTPQRARLKLPLQLEPVALH